MRLLITGGRAYQDWKRFNKFLDAMHSQNPIALIIEGGAPGADGLARAWAFRNSVPNETFAADWDNVDGLDDSQLRYHSNGKPYNKLAGFLRNMDMLMYGKPDLVFGFPGDSGTAHMLQASVDAGVPTLKIGDVPFNGGLLVTQYDEDGNEIPTASTEWLCRPDPSKPRIPRPAPPTPEGRYEALF